MITLNACKFHALKADIVSKQCIFVGIFPKKRLASLLLIGRGGKKQERVFKIMKLKFVDAILATAVLGVVVSGFAHTWNQATTMTSAGSTDMSADGRIICVINSATHPFISTDSGKTWAIATNSPPWGSAYIGGLAINADGSKIFAALSTNSPEQTWMFLSTDKGMSWAKTGFPSITPSTLFPIACSADGSRVIALFAYGTGGTAPGQLFYSTNGGVDCYTSSIPTTPYCVACSADGNRMITGTVGGIYYSSDFGVNWTPGTFLSPIDRVCTSSDGKWIGALGGATYISSDSGVTWRTNNLTGTTIACSANGTNWIIAGDHIYTSLDGGLTWQTNLSAAQWLGGAVSADGAEMVAVGSGQGTWIGRVTPSPQLNIQQKNPDLTVSWLLPSTNLVLQQNTDLTTTNWITVPGNPTLNFTNLQQEITVPATTTNTFYRLMAQ